MMNCRRAEAYKMLSCEGKPMKEKRRRFMEFFFVLLLVAGAVGIQFCNGWLSKNQFGLNTFLMILPLFIIAQYFVSWGYHDGTAQSSFITAHVVWTAVLVFVTLGVNYALFQNVPSLTNVFALFLAAAAAALSVLGN